MDISIIIPTLNRSAFLELTLVSILNQEKSDARFEIIVIDNGSVDDTKVVCERYSQKFRHFTYNYDAVPGQLTGRHKGYQLAKGDMLCYLDDDVELNPGWLNSVYVLSLQHGDIGIFGGPSLPKYAVQPPSWISRFWTPTPFGGKACLPLSLISLESDGMLISPLYIFGLNFSIRRETLSDLKGFHPDCIPACLQQYQGDGETGLAIKAAMNNVKAMYSSLLTLHHQVPAERMTAGYFSKWSFYNGVCQSFTDLRYRHRLYFDTALKQETKAGVVKTVDRIVARISGGWSRWLQNSREVNQMLDGINDAYHKGYSFHQNAFESDQKVRDWVLRTDYFNYKLPL